MTVHAKGPDLAGLAQNVRKLLRNEVLVGIPGETAARSGGDAAGLSNAVIGYLMETGVPEKNIPARPFLAPGVARVQSKLVDGLRIAAQASLIGDDATIDRQLAKIGLTAQASAKQTILDGAFAPLSERTLQARASRRTGNGKLSGAETSKAARRELASRAGGNAPSAADARPLYDTHSLFNAITYVVRPRGR